MKRTASVTFFITCLMAIAILAGLTSCKSRDDRLQSRHDPYFLDTCRQMWRSFNYEGRDDDLIEYTRPLRSQAWARGDTVSAMYCEAYLAQAWMFKDNEDSARYYLDALEQASVEECPDETLKFIYNSIKSSYAIKYYLDYSLAMDYGHRSYLAAVASGDVSNRIGALLDIVYIYYIRQDKSGLPYAEEALTLSQNDGVAKDYRSSALLIVSMMNLTAGDVDAATQHARQSLQIATEEGITSQIAMPSMIIGDALCLKEDFVHAEEAYRKALNYSHMADVGTATLIYLKYGKLLMDRHRFEEAKNMLSKGLEVSYRYNNNECRKDLLYSMVDVCMAMEDKEETLYYMTTYRSYVDSIAAHRKELEFHELLLSLSHVEHEHEMKAAELKIVRSQQHLTRILAAAVMVLMLLVFFVMLNRKQRKSYKLAVEKWQLYAERFKRENDAMQQVLRQGTKVVLPHVGGVGSAEVAIVPEGAGGAESSESSERVEGTEGETADGRDSEMYVQLFARIDALMREEKLYRQQGVSREMLAEMLSTNRTYISKAINYVSGKSFSEYINAHRIIEATDIISSSDEKLSLKGLADQLGYASLSAFTKAFQKETGISAGNYQKEIRTLKITAP